MTYEDMLRRILNELPLPEGQMWVSLEELRKAAETLDGDKERPNN